MEREDVEDRGDKGVNPSARRSNWVSWLIPIIVLVNIAVFVVEMYVNNCPKHIRNRAYSFGVVDDDKCVARFLGRFSFQPLSDNPLFGPSSSALDKMGALNWAKVVHQNQSWRLISCIWLHAGLIHLLVNMLCLVVIGIRLEQQFGFVRIGVIYLLSGIGGSILSSLFIKNRISVGASGALFGLLGAMLSELISNWSIYSNKVAALVTLVVIVVINLALGILPHVNNFAHIGGFLTGFLLGFILLPRPQLGWMERHNLPVHTRPRSKYKVSQYVLGLLSLFLVISGFTVGLVMVFRGENLYERCHWCRYANCVPTSKWKCDE